MIISGKCFHQRLQWDGSWLQWDAEWWIRQSGTGCIPSTRSVLWEICLQNWIFWRKQMGPFTLRVFINIINGMRNSLGNGSLAFEFKFNFYFWQNFCEAFEFPFTSLRQHHSFPKLCCQFQEGDRPTCCPSEYFKSDLFPQWGINIIQVNRRAQWETSFKPVGQRSMPALASHLELRPPYLHYTDLGVFPSDNIPSCSLCKVSQTQAAQRHPKNKSLIWAYIYPYSPKNSIMFHGYLGWSFFWI